MEIEMTMIDELPVDPMDNPPRWQDGEGNTFYRASSLGMCDRVFVALSQRYDPAAHPAWFMEVLQEGKDQEQAIIDMYLTSTESQFAIVNQQATFNLQILPNVFITGHIDGEFSGEMKWGAEVKKIRDGQWTKFLRSGVEYLPYYPWQVSAYWFGMGWEECAVIGGRYVDGVITETYVHNLLSPPIPLIGLRKRIIALEVAINDATHVQDTPCNIRQFPCPFYYLHDADDDHEPPTRPTDDLIAPLLLELATLEPKVAEANRVIKKEGGRVKEIKTGITGWLDLAGVEDRTPIRVGAGDVTYEIKASKVDRDGYEVAPTDYVLVNVTAIGADGKKITKPRAPRKASAKKAANVEVGSEVGTVNTQVEATQPDGPDSNTPEFRPVPSFLDPATHPHTSKLPPRPNLRGKALGN